MGSRIEFENLEYKTHCILPDLIISNIKFLWFVPLHEGHKQYDYHQNLLTWKYLKPSIPITFLLLYIGMKKPAYLREYPQEDFNSKGFSEFH